MVFWIWMYTASVMEAKKGWEMLRTNPCRDSHLEHCLLNFIFWTETTLWLESTKPLNLVPFAQCLARSEISACIMAKRPPAGPQKDGVKAARATHPWAEGMVTYCKKLGSIPISIQWTHYCWYLLNACYCHSQVWPPQDGFRCWGFWTPCQRFAGELRGWQYLWAFANVAGDFGPIISRTSFSYIPSS